MNIARPLRITAAGSLLVGGLVHLQLYFDTVGEFSFVCGIHPQMKGTITITS